VDCVYHHRRQESNPRDFFKVALFSGQERNDVALWSWACLFGLQ
jgi:hypothetical protein